MPKHEEGKEALVSLVNEEVVARSVKIMQNFDTSSIFLFELFFVVTIHSNLNL